MSHRDWKQALQHRIPEQWGHEIDIFEAQFELRRQGKIDEKVFAETRLRRGTYGQRYDNGQRHDGTAARELKYPCGELTKGPDTVWDAPGMQRIKIPYGGVSPEQMEVLADLAEEYSDAICHITPRQDVQLHYVRIDDTPDLMRRLAAVGITMREACGNSGRNVTGCPLAGVCHDEPFDISPYAQALMSFLLGHPDVQDFGRKFKPAFSGCSEHACGLVTMHDIGYVARVQEVDGESKRGFAVYVGGGLGERLRPALRHLLEAAQRIQAGPEELPEAPRFRTDRLRVYFADRLNAPNTEESFEAVRPELACALAGLFGAEPELSRAYEGPRWLLAVDAAAPGTDDLPTLLSRVADESVPSG